MRIVLDENRKAYCQRILMQMGDKAAYECGLQSACWQTKVNTCLDYENDDWKYRNCNIQEIVSRYIDGEPDIGQVPVNVDERLSGEQIRMYLWRCFCFMKARLPMIFVFVRKLQERRTESS